MFENICSNEKINVCDYMFRKKVFILILFSFYNS